MKPVRLLLALAALPLTLYCQAQGAIGASPDAAVKTPQERSPSKPSEPAPNAAPDPGAVVVPPKVDPEAIETPPKNIDPDISKPPPATTQEKPGKSQRKSKSKSKSKAKPQPKTAPS